MTNDLMRAIRAWLDERGYRDPWNNEDGLIVFCTLVDDRLKVEVYRRRHERSSEHRTFTDSRTFVVADPDLFAQLETWLAERRRALTPAAPAATGP